jgi:pilus assembly protein CpaB
LSTVTQAQPKPATTRRQLLLAAALGVLAAIFIALFLNSADGRSNSEPSVASVSIVVASRLIEPGKTITDAMVGVRTIPQTAAPTDAFGDKALVVGRVARYPIEENEPLRAARLVDAPKVQSLSFQIPAGMRGMSIPVDINKSPAALLVPGDFVDVLVSVEIALLGVTAPVVNSDNDELEGAVTLLQNVQVLSVQRNYAETGVVYDASTRGQPLDEKETVNFVTLAVSPEDAQLLWLAQSKGKLTLILRPFGEDNRLPLRPVTEPLNLR